MIATLRQRLLAAIALLPTIAVAVLALLSVALLSFFSIRTLHLLAYPYPLDYGEGPLLAQIELLLSGTPIWLLYGDPGRPPYQIVNYPPVYHLFSLIPASFIRFISGSDTIAALIGGRLISVVAAIMTLIAIRQLTLATVPQAFWRSTLLACTVLGIPIFREWSALVRVDMLGVCLGLWGLVCIQQPHNTRRLFGGAVLLALCVLTKPSLIAAPAAALLWLLLHQRRQALIVGATMLLIGGLAALLLHIGSGGWFFFHVLTANANPWDLELARGFWRDQWAIHWPLVAAGTLAAAYTLRYARESSSLPIFYTLFGALVAFGIGKYGAYVNYFLDFYAGLIWLIAIAFTRLPSPTPAAFTSAERPIRSLMITLVLIGTMGGLLRYYPLWSQTFLKPYGLIEGANPPRLSFGAYGIWSDLQREAAILHTLTRINQALVQDVRTAAAPIVTDVPGIAAQAGRLTRMQVFEHRQIYDIGQWDQRPLLRDLANGQVPLVVLDFLGNWMTPEMVTIIRHRYAQAGARGPYDIFRPINSGPYTATTLEIADTLQLRRYALAPPIHGNAYAPGETLLLTLEWQARGSAPADLEVVIVLTDSFGTPLIESTRPLLYGVLPPSEWDGPVQHIQTLDLPAELPPFRHQLAITLRANGHDLAPPQSIASFEIGEVAGVRLGEPDYYVPAPFLQVLKQSGGTEQFGTPIMPPVHFPGGSVQQCFTWNCLTLNGNLITRLPLGELVALGDDAVPVLEATPPELRGIFRAYWETQGGEAVFGPPITGELVRRNTIVQYTRYARLERPLDSNTVVLGRLGEEYLRQPAWVRYRWP